MRPAIFWGAAIGLLAWIFKEEPDMAAVQKHFDEFHGRIKLDEDDEKRKLIEKRELLLGELKKALRNIAPTFTSFNQGSYSMHTGVVPLDGNYDIDVGLVFDCKRDAYPDPVALKKIVRDALLNGNRKVDIRRPCITVTYQKDGNPEYHVDLVVYVTRNDNKLDLAKGKEHSEANKRIWEPSEPKRLTDLVNTRFDGAEDMAQFRRCIRYMKRWRDYQLGSSGPLSIALTVSALNDFQPNKEFFGDKYFDLLALKNWVNAMLVQFQPTFVDGETTARLKVPLPVTPHSDLMEGMTNRQMEKFKGKLENLRDALSSAEDEVRPEEACRTLAKQFGEDFPVPPKEDTAKSVPAPFVSTGHSA